MGVRRMEAVLVLKVAVIGGLDYLQYVLDQVRELLAQGDQQGLETFLVRKKQSAITCGIILISQEAAGDEDIRVMRRIERRNRRSRR